MSVGRSQLLHRIAARHSAEPEPARWAEDLLQRAVELDEGRPSDDITVLVAVILKRQGDDVRRLSLRMAL